MKKSAIQTALADLESDLESARAALSQIEGEDTGLRPSGRCFADPEDALTAYLKSAYELILVTLEAANLTETRSCLLEKWRKLKQSKGGIGATNHNPLYV
ncbi:hypothetical protein PJI16_05700 [Nitrospira sp. MA-1]|nr:hypothetical protein [Nitrospira sp. MA-1]